MNHTPHPTYPFRDEERDEICTAMNSPTFSHHDVVTIRNKYEAMRNDQFPGWHERYQAEMQEWFKGSKA